LPHVGDRQHLGSIARGYRKVPQIAFKSDWTRHAKAAPFRRNDQMLAVLPIGVTVFPGSGTLASRKLDVGSVNAELRTLWEFDKAASTDVAFAALAIEGRR
jgi:hypothetical protein